MLVFIAVSGRTAGRVNSQNFEARMNCSLVHKVGDFWKDILILVKEKINREYTYFAR